MQLFRVLLQTIIVLTFVSKTAFCSEVETTQQVDPAFLRQLQNVPIYTIAVLPVGNLSVDPDVAYHFRQRIIERLRTKGYTLVNDEDLDKKLHDIGVGHAGQLGLLPFKELREISSANGFLSGAVEQSATQHAGIYNSYVYMCSIKLQDRDGKVIWASLLNRVTKHRFAIDPINALLDIALTEGGGNSQEAAYALADQMLAFLPEGPAEVVLGDSLLDMAIEVSTKPYSEKK